MDAPGLIPILESNLARHLAWIAGADTKTGFVFAADTAMLGLLAATAPTYGSWTSSGLILSTAAAVLLLLSLVSVALAVFPRTKGPKLSTVFFGAVAERTVDQFRADTLALDESTYIEDLVQQCHINATIASVKFRWVKRASILLFAAVLPWVVATYFLFRDRA